MELLFSLSLTHYGTALDAVPPPGAAAHRSNTMLAHHGPGALADDQLRALCDRLHLRLRYEPISGDLNVAATIAPKAPAVRQATYHTNITTDPTTAAYQACGSAAWCADLRLPAGAFARDPIAVLLAAGPVSLSYRSWDSKNPRSTAIAVASERLVTPILA